MMSCSHGGVSPRVLLGIGILSLAALFLPAQAAPVPASITLDLREVELADDPLEMERGLMFRRELCDACGMLFVYSEPRPVTFWMKNTYLSLDMIFMDGAGRILSLYRETEPLREFPLYPSRGEAKYVLEVNAGFVRREGLEPGQRIDLDRLRAGLVDYRWPEGHGPGTVSR